MSLINDNNDNNNNNNNNSNNNDNNNDNINNDSDSSLHVNVTRNNVDRDEEYARLLQRRDSLLQHFQLRSSNNNHHHHHQHHHSLTSAFDINALRQRTQHQLNNSNLSSSRPRHRHSQSQNGSDLVRHLPIRQVQESDIGKGDESLQVCSICQEKFKIGDKVKTLPCFHFFHVKEIDRWLQNSRACPVCRHSIDQINFK